MWIDHQLNEKNEMTLVFTFENKEKWDHWYACMISCATEQENSFYCKSMEILLNQLADGMREEKETGYYKASLVGMDSTVLLLSSSLRLLLENYNEKVTFMKKKEKTE